MNLRIYGEVVRSFDLVAEDENGETLEDWRFRVEIVKKVSDSKYISRVWRQQFFRLNPTFQPNGNKSEQPDCCDEMFYIEEASLFDLYQVESAKWQITLQKTLELLRRQLGIHETLEENGSTLRLDFDDGDGGPAVDAEPSTPKP